MKIILIIGFSCLEALVAAQPPLTESQKKMERIIRHPSECCTRRPLIDEAAFSTCKAKYPDDVGINPRFCIWVCFFNQTGIYKNGVLVRETAVSVLGINMDEPMTKLLADSVETCFSKHESYQKSMLEDNYDPNILVHLHSMDNENKTEISKCYFEKNFVIPCIEMQICKNCPAEKRDNSEECNALFRSWIPNLPY